ncbi:MAG TPA: DUF1109 domain-containing protein, partial [Archangium sp.]|nr:DUF1109 domain-containing protein [Archangium sp.]
MSPECSRVLDSLGHPLPPELAAHVASCPECRPLVEGFGALEDLAPAPKMAAPAMERVRTRTQEELAAQPLPTPWWREVLVLMGVYVGLTALGALALTPLGLVLNPAPPGVVVGLSLLVLLAMVGGAVVALAPVRQVAWSLMGLCTAVVALSVVLGGSGLAVKSFLAGAIGCVKTHLLLSALTL